MDIGERRIWQQAAGDTDRNYVDLCLRWGVILNGPGYLGAWPACREPLRNEGWSSRKLSDLRRFCEEMIDGDLVVLRLGTGVVPAVGVVDGNYVWSDAFGDVDGWDLQHVRRVRWLWIGNEAKSFGTYALKLGDTTQLLNDGVVREWISSLEHNSAGPFPALPVVSESSEISHERISEFLFDEGVASASIRSLMGEIGELTRIAKWYQRAAPPSEHETVAYLVVPLLRALGWTPQRMGVEWYRLDVALFDSLPRGDETLRVVVEAKKMGNSCLSAKSQAAAYAEGRAGCLRLIVTDGIRYGVYIKQKSGEFELYAYLNLARLRDEYPVYGCHGAEEALLAMSPEWRPERTNSRRLRADRLEEV